MTDFADLAALTRGTVAAVMGETVTIVPVKKTGGPNASTVAADPARPQFTARAVPYRVLTGVGERGGAGGAIGTSGAKRMPLHQAQDTFLALDVPAADLAEGDRIIRANGSWWAMRAPQTDEAGTMVLSIYRSSEVA